MRCMRKGKTAVKFRTGLQLSAIFPIAFALAAILILKWQAAVSPESDVGDLAMMSMIGLIGVTMAAVIISYSRGIVARIAGLNEWAQTVLNGQLDARLALDASDDEVGRLSCALSRMLSDIRAAYASVQAEAEQHKKGMTASQLATKHLSDALVRMKSSQQDIVRQGRMNALQQVIRGITHDLSDAMTPILGVSEMILARPAELDDRNNAVELIRLMHNAAEQARRSLRSLAGFFQTAEEINGPTDVAHAIESAVKLTEPRWRQEASAEGGRIRVRTEIETTPPVTVDEHDLEDAIVHLIMNAVEAMPAGGILTVGCRTGRDTVTVEVKDTGKGMDAEVRARCLEPFFSTKKAVASGMGLTVVESVVRRHKGHLEIDSLPGRGTRVTMILPVWRGDNSGSKTGTQASQDIGQQRIIVVDDDPWPRRVLRETLDMNGHLVETAEDARECLEKMKTAKFDVAIVDRAMPIVGGDELAKLIKQQWPAMPVLMLSGFGGIMIAENETPPNVDFVLSKPTSGEDLQRGVATVVNLVKARAEQAGGSKKDISFSSSVPEGETVDGRKFKWLS